MSPKQKQNTERINVFFSPTQLEQIKANADRLGISVSAYVRMIVIERTEKKTKTLECIPYEIAKEIYNTLAKATDEYWSVAEEAREKALSLLEFSKFEV